MTVPHIAFVGYSGSGKTTVAVQVAARLKAGGLRVGVLKHDVHGMSLGSSGKDTDHYWRSGADRVVLDSPDGLLMLQRPPASSELGAKLAFFAGMDVVLLEGYKREPVPKVLVARTRQQLELGSELTGLAALAVPFDAGDGDLDNKEWNAFLNQAEPGKAWDVLNLNDPDEIAEWVKAFINRNKGRD